MNTPKTTMTAVCSDAGITLAVTPAPALAATRAPRAPAGLRGSERTLIALGYVLVVGLVLVAYFTARARDPGLFAWGRHLLSLERGLWMTAVLPVGGLALLAAVHFARRGRRRASSVALLLAVLAGGAFLAVGAIDYDSKIFRRLVPGMRFRPGERYVARQFGVRLPKDWSTRSAPLPTAAAPAAATPAAPVVREVSAAQGRELFLRVCASCHGPQGEGLPGSGKALRANEFVASLDDAKLVDFLKVGRQPWDPANTTKVQMPGRGGDPRVTDDDLRDVAAYLRELQTRHAGMPATPASTSAATQPAPGADSATAPPAVEEPQVFVVYRSYLPEAPPGPHGLSPAYLAELGRPRWAIPENARDYFGVFFALTGLGMLHVFAALLAVLAALYALLRLRAPTTVPPRLVAATAAWWWATGCWGLVFLLVYA